MIPWLTPYGGAADMRGLGGMDGKHREACASQMLYMVILVRGTASQCLCCGYALPGMSAAPPYPVTQGVTASPCKDYAIFFSR